MPLSSPGANSSGKAITLELAGAAVGEDGEGYVRIAFVQTEERIREAFKRIGTFLQTK